MPLALGELSQCNCFAVRAAARHVTQFYDHVLAPVGLRTTQFTILTALHTVGAATINTLAKLIAMDRTTLGRNILPLVRDGLVVADTDRDDRRAKRLRVTPAGEARLGAAAERWREAQRQFEATVGADHAADYRAVLRAVVETPFEPRPARRTGEAPKPERNA